MAGIPKIYNVSSQRTPDGGAGGTFLRKSAVQQKYARKGVFTSRPMGAVKVIGYYNESMSQLSALLCVNRNI